MAKIDDISRITGFSRTTVSKALNDKSDISESTKEIIRKAAKDLNYIPNINARNLRYKNNNIIAVIISSPSVESEKTGSLYPFLIGVNNFLNENNLELALYMIDSEKQNKKSYVEFCKERNVSGVILVGIKTDDIYLNQLVDSEIPCVLIDVNVNNESQNLSILKIDDTEASFEAVDYLIKNNHKEIGFINGVINSTVSKDRLEGYKLAMESNRLNINNKYIINADFSEKIAEEKIEKLLKNYPDITALFCASDLMALGAMSAIEKLGLIIPDDISLIGFDDIPISKYVKPSLTTISQNFYEKGFIAAELIYTRLNSNDTSKIVNLDHKLIIRDSVAFNKIDK